MNRKSLLALFALSGACGLVYELVWMRRLALVFGSTTLAISTVLASFMGGLALGSWLLGRYADRHPDRSLRLYGWLELGIGAAALSIPFLLRAAERVYLAAYPRLEGSPELFLLLQFLLVSAILVIPTAFMGGTLPLLVRYSVRRDGEIGSRVGGFYAANTIGAAAGTILSTYVLLPYTGVANTELAAAATNFAIGGIVLLLAVRATAARRFAAEKAEILRSEPRAARLRAGDLSLLVGIGLSGFAAIAYEVIWSRVLSSVLGSSVYALGMVLLVFLLGISLGSAVVGRLRLSGPAARESFAITQAGLTLAGLVALDRLPHLPAFFLTLFPGVRSSFLNLQLAELLVVAALLFVPALLLGAAFPSVVAATTDSADGAGGGVGRVIVWNTAGNVVGAFVGGFLLIPHLGLSASFVVIIAASGLATLIAALASPMRRKGLALLAACGSVTAAILLPAWPPEVLASGVGFFAGEFKTPKQWREAMDALDLLFYKDGVNTTISVDRAGPYIYYRSNGKTDASTSPGDMTEQLYLGHLGMLLHPNPRDVFVIGLGTGVTAASAARYPVRSIDIADIEPSSREASGFFAARNRNVLADPRVRLLIADGRNALLARPKTYDVVISDPSDVWVAGVGHLFTREFYEIARSRLRPGGVMIQWLHLHALPPEQFRRIAASFRSVFPHATLWHTNRGAVILAGTVDPVPWSFQRITRALRDLPGVAKDFHGLGLDDPLSIFAGLALSETDYAAWISKTPELHTDDRPTVEFFTPRALYEDTVSANDEELQKAQRELLPPMADFPPGFWTPAARYTLGAGYMALARTRQGLRLLEEAVRLEPTNATFLTGLGEVYAHIGRDDAAADHFRRALQSDPGNPIASVGLAAILQKQNRVPEAEAILGGGLARTPDEPSLLQAAGNLSASLGQHTEALSFYERALQRSPGSAPLALAAGQSLLALSRPAEARARFQQAIEQAPTDPFIQREAGKGLLQIGDNPGAVAAFSKALALDALDRESLLGLYEAARRGGDAVAAARAQEQLRRTR
ncbi:MAG TPA: fused MFS/spermidine synthase [Thermoanaerobaculia bacterium]